MAIPQPSRKVVYTGLVLQQIKDGALLARQRGIKSAFLDAVEAAHHFLLTRPLPPSEDPNVFGEPKFRLHHLGLLVCSAAIAPIAISFGVSLSPQRTGDEEFIGVYVREIRLIGNS